MRRKNSVTTIGDYKICHAINDTLEITAKVLEHMRNMQGISDFEISKLLLTADAIRKLKEKTE